MLGTGRVVGDAVLGIILVNISILWDVAWICIFVHVWVFGLMVTCSFHAYWQGISYLDLGSGTCSVVFLCWVPFVFLVGHLDAMCPF